MDQIFKKRMYKTITLYNLLILLLAVVFYYAIPLLLNYPPNSINTEFEKTIDMGLNYYVQYIATVILAMIVSNTTFFLEIRRVKNWKKYVNYTGEKNKELDNIKQNCFKIPIQLYLIHAVIPSIASYVLLIAVGSQNILAARISICLLAVFITIGLLIYVLSRGVFNEILEKINNQELYKKKITLTSYRARIFFQFLPLTLLIGTYAFLVVNSVSIQEKGQLLYERNYYQLQQQILTDDMNLEEAISNLKKINKQNEKDTYFIINRDKVLYQDNNNEITEFFIKYTFSEGKDGRTYGYYATDIQGVYKIVNIDGKECAVGIMYGTSFDSGYTYIVATILGIGSVVVLFLLFFSKDFTIPIVAISKYMRNLSSGKSIDYDKKIPVTSNDELGELTVSFNEILDLEKKHVETIKGNQDALVESGRLSSLGQMIGGIAHNLKTPIMSISGNLQGIQDLITEYHSSVGDPEVTDEDHKAIASDMQELVDKTRVYLTYMSDIITAVKGQAVQMDSSEEQVFGVLEVLNRIDVLMKHELKSALIELVTSVQEEAKTAFIRGDINSLVQVINNLIQNAIYSYEGRKNETIELTITKEGKVICLKLRDYGCGIPDNVKDKLFKEMITTKGKNGTGLGLYMSYSTIKGKFKGDFTFESEQGKGTTFYIKIPTI